MSLEHYKGDRNPSAFHTVRVGNVPVDLSTATAKLQMRLESGSTLKVDAAATVVSASTTLTGAHELPNRTLTVADTSGFLDEGAVLVGGEYVFYEGKTATTFVGCTTSGTGTLSNGATVAQAGGVRYDWAAADVDMADAPGLERADYVLWWLITIGGKTQRTPPEQLVMIDAGFGSIDLCNLMDVREVLEHEDGQRNRDPLIQALIPAASQHIIDEYEREFAPATDNVTRRFRVGADRYIDNGYHVPLEKYDLRVADTVTLNPEESSPTVLTTADYFLNPDGGRQGTYQTIVLRRSLVLSSEQIRNFGFAWLDIAGDWGLASVPRPVRTAAAFTVRSWMRHFPAGTLAEIEDPRSLVGTIIPGTFGIPPDARNLLHPYGRWPRRR